MFCGAGGFTTGAKRAYRNMKMRYALNHWDRAIQTHSANYPETEHILAEIDETRPEYCGHTTFLLASPECTNHSLAKGAQRKHLNQMRLPLEDEPPLPSEAEIRSRCMMWDPLRWAAKNRYMFIVLENVVDVAFWDEYDEWLRSWKRIDKDLQYEFAILYLNSMFFPPTPQSRDRWYFVAWQKGLRPPKLDYRPKAYCQVCSGVIDAVQSWKRPEHPWGRYGKNRQYVYRCPRCASEVLPYYCPAFNAIEWSFPTQKIGERDKPLAPKTMERIRYGMEKFRGAPFTTQLNKTTTRSFPMLTGVFPTQTGDNGQALIDPSVPFMLSLSHAGSGYVYSLDQSMPTQTARHETGMALPPAFLFGMNHEPRVTEMWEAMDTQTTYDDTAIVQGPSEQYSPFILDHLAEYRPRDLYWALSTMCASGNHQSIIFPPFITELHGTSHAREVTDALSTLCAGGQHHGLVTPPAGALPAWLVSYYNNGQMIQVSHPSPTMTTHDRCGLLTGSSPASTMIDILECGFRMLQPDPEIKRAMAFPETYIVTGTRREQVKLYGNAVTSPVVEWIIRQCLEALAA